MVDTTWDIVTNSNGTLVATGVERSNYPTFRPGDSLTLPFFFDEGQTNHLADYETIREMVEYATDDTITTGSDIYGVPYFREKLHPNADFDSFLVELKPSADIASIEDYWAVVVGGSDATQFPGGGERIEVEVVLIARSSQYSGRTDIEDQLRADR